jgi:DNA-binding MarR family transcriptional regulator
MLLQDHRTRKEIGKRCACFNLRKAARLVTQRFDRSLRHAGVTANQFSILMASYDQDGILLTQLANRLGMERTTLSRHLSLLKRRKMVSIARGDDRRKRKVTITQKGVSLLEKAFILWEEAQNEVVEAIGPKEWERLLGGLHKLARSL